MIINEFTDKYGVRCKKVIFKTSTKEHVDLKVKLKYDKINQTQFFNLCMKMYLQDNPLMREMINQTYKIATTLEVVKEDQKELEDTKKKFGLEEDERQNIFDMMEKAHPEL